MLTSTWANVGPCGDTLTMIEDFTYILLSLQLCLCIGRIFTQQSLRSNQKYTKHGKVIPLRCFGIFSALVSSLLLLYKKTKQKNFLHSPRGLKSKFSY